MEWNELLPVWFLEAANVGLMCSRPTPPNPITHSELEEVISCRFFLSITSPSDSMVLKLPDAGHNRKKGLETSVLYKCSPSPSCVSGKVPRVGVLH